MGDNITAQNLPAPDTGKELWPIIEAQLDKQESDTAFYFILQKVRTHCGQYFDCLFNTYYTVMIKLESRFNLPAAIYVGEEMAKRRQPAPC
ncbi:MAG: hypothetical protein ACE5FF_05855 [Saprospiraceae bacterium]